MDTTVCRECLDPTVPPVILVPAAPLDLLDPEVLLVLMAQLVRMEELDPMVLLDPLVAVDPPDTLDLLVLLDLLVSPDPLAPPVVDTMFLEVTMSTGLTSPPSEPRTTRWTPPSSP